MSYRGSRMCTTLHRIGASVQPVFPSISIDVLDADGSSMADYTLRQLEYFVAVAEAGSVTHAAAAVPLSQSAMSAALADLENALSVQLLVRHHAKGITLTSAGRELLIASRQLLAMADDLRHVAQGLGASLTGTLSIGCFE